MNTHILIVEDEPDIREAMAEAITEAGFTVSIAENGSVGLALSLSERPDLILLDIKMPIMDGHKMLERLRTDPWGRQARVIVLTSMDDVKNIALAHEGAITDYIIKAHSSLEDIVKKIKMTVYNT